MFLVSYTKIYVKRFGHYIDWDFKMQLVSCPADGALASNSFFTLLTSSVPRNVSWMVQCFTLSIQFLLHLYIHTFS